MSGLITHQRDRLAQNAEELEEAYVSTVRVVAAAIDARESYTLGHSTRVSELAVAMAERLGWRESEREDVEIACLFHDVSK
jgi:HD-GYP domain-containing protein (c-di-GMP phosphodiesterase class II)